MTATTLSPEGDGPRKRSACLNGRAIGYICAASILRFDVGSDGLQSCLVGGIHTCGREVFDLSVEQQAQRPAIVVFAQIEFEAVRLGESFEGQDFKVPDIFLRAQIG